MASQRILWRREIVKPKRMLQNKEEQVAQERLKVARLTERCQVLKDTIERKALQIIELNQKNQAVQLDMLSTYDMLKAHQEITQDLQVQNAAIKGENNYLNDKSNFYEGQHKLLVGKSCDLLEEAKMIAEKAKEKAKEI